jgi:hypothetical protein
MISKNVVSYLSAADIGKLALTNRQFLEVVRRSVCWDVVEIAASDYFLAMENQDTNPVVSARFVVTSVYDELPLKNNSWGLIVGIIFHPWFNRPIELGALPMSLTSLEFGICFNQSLAPGVLPPLLTSLVFGHEFNQPLASGVLPPLLKSLDLGWCFNQPIEPGVLPPLLKSLDLGWCFNQPIEPGVLPPSLESLKLSNHFNQSVELEVFLTLIILSTTNQNIRFRLRR